VRLVVGLGNPGARYERTRHNIGFLLADRLASSSKDWRVADQACAHVATTKRAGQEVFLVKPQTYMNRSGETLSALSSRLDFTPEQVLVLLDDFELDFGRLRLRRSGSDGGHNGLASVLEALQTTQVPRLRLGIGKPPENEEILDFVLNPFAAADDIEGLIERGIQAVDVYLTEGIEAAMNRFNGLPAL